MNNQNSPFRYYLALPQDHGSWVFILSPLIIGLFAGGKFTNASLALVVAAMAAFLIRQPVTIEVKVLSGRRAKEDLLPAGFWTLIYGLVILLTVIWLVILGDAQILILAIPAVPVFLWHLWLVSRREERRQAGVEILGTGVLALAAPAAYWVGTSNLNSIGWLLWALVWFQSAASIVYAYLRLAQRQWKTVPDLTLRFQAGRRAISYSLFNLILACGLGFLTIIPGVLWLPFTLQAAESIWGTLKPAIGIKPVAVGIRQLVISTLFTILFVITWR